MGLSLHKQSYLLVSSFVIRASHCWTSSLSGYVRLGDSLSYNIIDVFQYRQLALRLFYIHNFNETPILAKMVG